MIGKTIAQYRILEALGQGGMGSVYKAHDNQLDRMVVLKLLSSDLLAHDVARRRFLREARLASALDHPNICMIYEIQENAEFYYIAMQYIEGNNLKKVINNRPLSAATLTSLALQIADALATAHDHGIIHRDIKPQNIMVTSRGQAKVLDFGLAKSLKEDRQNPRLNDLTEFDEIPGTPAYMSPEQAKRERVDRRSDIFSFGIVLYEMATGFKPFVGKDNVELLHNICNHVPRPIMDLHTEASPVIQQILDRALDKNSNNRYQTMQAMLADLKMLDNLSGLHVPDGIHRPFAPINSVKTRWLDRLIPRSLRRQPSGATPTQARPLPVSPLASPPASSPTSSPVQEISQARTLSSTAVPNIPKDDFPLLPGQHKTAAVLPLRNLGGTLDRMWSLSFLEALISELAKFKSLTIRPSSYVSKYLNQDYNPADVAMELGVDAVFTGSFIGSETKIRVTVQLISVASGDILWAGKVDAHAHDPVRLQDIICQTIMAQLTGKQQSSNAIELIRDENEEIRLDAIATIKYSQDTNAADALIDALLDKSVRVKACAAQALANFGRYAAPGVLTKLEEALKTSDFETARYAILAAGLINSAELLPILLEALGSEDSFVASEAARALGRLGDQRALVDLLEALSSPDANVRFTSAQALGELNSMQALEALELRLLKDEDEGVRAKAFWAIKFIRKNNPMALSFMQVR